MPYVATICILVDVDSEAEAMDAIAETMRPLMQPFNSTSCLRDWMWDNAAPEGELIKVGPIHSDFQMDNEWPDALVDA